MIRLPLKNGSAPKCMTVELLNKTKSQSLATRSMTARCFYAVFGVKLTPQSIRMLASPILRTLHTAQSFSLVKIG